MMEIVIMFFVSILRLEYSFYDAPVNEPFHSLYAPALDFASLVREKSVTRSKLIGISFTLRNWSLVKSLVS